MIQGNERGLWVIQGNERVLGMIQEMRGCYG